MTPKGWHFSLQRFFVSFLVYQGVLWTMPHRSQASGPLDDEDYLTGKGRVARSSSGSCRRGWSEFGEKCYIIFGKEYFQRRIWSDANQQCRHLGATLVSIHSKEEQDHLLKVFPHSQYETVWIGLHRKNKGQDLSWVDGSPFDFSNTYSSTRHRGRTCAEMSLRDGIWAVGSCRISRSYICQRYKGPNVGFLDESSGDGEEPLCTDDTCQNGGSCVDDTAGGNFRCICANGYKGERCEERSTCTEDACENGGSCVEDAEVGDFECICMDGFNGERCGEKDSVPGFDISEYIYIIGAVTAAISLIIIVVVFVLFKRRKNKNDSVARPAEDKSVTVSFCKRTQSQD